MRRALLVVPTTQLSVGEYRGIRRLLEKEGFQVQVGSSHRDKIELTGFELTPDVELARVRAADYDLVVFVGGRGNKEFWQASEAHQLARDALAAGKVVGASGSAVRILANAGLLKGRRATGPAAWARFLEEMGAEYTLGPVASDDGIVTMRKSEGLRSFVRQLLAEVIQRTAGLAGGQP